MMTPSLLLRQVEAGLSHLPPLPSSPAISTTSNLQVSSITLSSSTTPPSSSAIYSPHDDIEVNAVDWSNLDAPPALSISLEASNSPKRKTLPTLGVIAVATDGLPGPLNKASDRSGDQALLRISSGSGRVIRRNVGRWIWLGLGGLMALTLATL